MNGTSGQLLRVGDWRVDPASGQISRQAQTVRIEVRTMRLLLCLAERAGQVVSIDQLLDQVWTGVVVSPDSVYQAVASLRRLLGDDARQPTYIETVPRLGYRMVAVVSPWTDESNSTLGPSLSPEAAATDLQGDRSSTGLGRKVGISLAAGAAFCLALILAFLFYSRIVSHPQAASAANAPARSVAVLPFLDLTSQEMNEEYFADGMTEELIGKLSKIAGLRVPPPTSSFYFKGKQVTVAEIARSLGVTYVLDGSIRKSGATLRVAARLVRASDGYVVWSETYDRSINDQLKVQEDIATEVAKALRVSLE